MDDGILTLPGERVTRTTDMPDQRAIGYSERLRTPMEKATK
jgi:hypothetical protein